MSHVLCAQLIALNFLLHKFPETKSQKRKSQPTSSNKQYKLPFSTERELVEILSYLSKSRDGSDYIPSVCVEQDRAASHLKVLLAVNKCTWNDGDDILRSIKARFEVIFDILRNAEFDRRARSTETREEILESIVAMCSPRILCRLRLTPSKRNGIRPSIKELLQVAIDGVGRISPQKFRDSSFTATSCRFISLSKEAVRLVNNWLNHRVQSRLTELLGLIRRLNEIPNLSDLLHLIPTGLHGVVQDSNFASCLCNIIRKVSRYHEAARILYHIAKRHPVVRNMKLQLATLPQVAYDRLNSPSHVAKLEDLVPLLGIINGHRYDVSQISRCMAPSKIKFSHEMFSQETQKALEESKIHSEIQLIAFCEIESSPELFPRVIASSKDACFLCNAFIKTHGKMHTSRTHGRLYPGWRLPNLLQMKGLQEELNQVLLNLARNTIGARIVGHKHIHPQPPYESTLLPLSLSPTTRSSFSLHLSSRNLQPTAVGEPIAKKLLSSTEPVPVSHKIGSVEGFPCILCTSEEATFVSGSLEVHIYMETTPGSCLTPHSIIYSIERIDNGGDERLPDGSLVIDPLGLTKETLYELPVDNAFYISCQDVTLKLESFPTSVG
ncbi:uncharacterized protein N7506_000105 [Penicillium brevicompactum]|uniref:uncharacterized protein n=1 Tax=Penicillium brevicompactum TaxID=5074 RepID=UPI0025406FBA|nr:uncharacterized protein N7506_000105 [Penicillium brevicompactum]KAJ5346852.1 hypothetical protein N7506_000105 [Penicillium brevicompactum]